MFIVFMAMLIVSVMKLALFMSILTGSVAIFAAFVMTTAVLMTILAVLMMKFAASVSMLIGFVAMNAVFGMMLIVMN